MTTTLNLAKLAQHFSDETAARTLLEKLRWPNGAACPHCGGADPYRLTPKPGSSTRPGVWKCRACRRQFTVTVGTIFEDSHVPLAKWLLAIHLLCSSKKGMSAHQLHRMLGVTYKTAWFMFHRLRHAMGRPPLVDKLRGVVEVDETYIGGRVPRRRRMSNKTAVVALVERSGKLRAYAMPRVTADDIRNVVEENIDKERTALMTDESRLYTTVGAEFPRHETVKHSIKEYVRGDAHTNTVENFFSLLKRGVNGVYHHVGQGHVGKYVDEFAFRYDTRKLSDSQRTAVAVLAAEGKRLTYRQPVQS